MPRRYSLPFKTALSSEIVLGAWHYRVGSGDWLRAEGGVAGWDYLAQLEFRREISIDAPSARRACEVEPRVPLELIVTAHSAAARFRAVVFRAPLTERPWSGFAEFPVESTHLAEQLRLDTEIILAKARGDARPFTARYTGSRLFTDSSSIDIEGRRGRMPLELTSFAQQLIWLDAPRAPWYVDCGSGDLHAPIMRDLRVFLNSDQPAFTASAQRGDETTLTLLRADIARQLLETALEDEAFRTGAEDYPEGSLGEAALNVLRLCFRDMKPTDVLTLARRNGGKFQGMIASRFSRNDG